ncbi:hypothetical protein Maes01_01525 [Microbulbifer aestuariivivens]|uniref:Mechanosensitive ion channel protein n=1 Tax=Microbulbifer aestuariivivens TaxID=1908308 RepID=A0ABP9WRW2_9GAMM
MDIVKQIKHLTQEAIKAIESDSFPELMIQVVSVIAIFGLCYILSRLLGKMLSATLSTGNKHHSNVLKSSVLWISTLAFPVLSFSAMRVADALAVYGGIHPWLMRLATALAMALVFSRLILLTVKPPHLASIIRFTWTPIAFVIGAGWIEPIINALNGMVINLREIKITGFDIARTLAFSSLIFWIATIASTYGKRIIRRQSHIDHRSREAIAKLYEIFIFSFSLLLILHLMGINLRALAVLGGALGVGIGFGLKSIASNFISGIILLMDRSITVGDYIEFTNGQAGTVTRLNMRSTTLETDDGKVVVIPNESFITGSFINWTHKSRKQRYTLTFTVSHDDDIDKIKSLVEQCIGKNPKVLNQQDSPTITDPYCGVSDFGESDVSMFVNFWSDIDNRDYQQFSADLMLSMLSELKTHHIQIDSSSGE